MNCPNCRVKLFKGDIVVLSEFIFQIPDDLKAEDIEKMTKEELNEKIKAKLVRKVAYCPRCGFVLAEKTFEGDDHEIGRTK